MEPQTFEEHENRRATNAHVLQSACRSAMYLSASILMLTIAIGLWG